MASQTVGTARELSLRASALSRTRLQPGLAAQGRIVEEDVAHAATGSGQHGSSVWDR